MKTKNIKHFLAAGLVCCGFTATLTSCSDDFLEVTKPDGEPLE